MAYIEFQDVVKEYQMGEVKIRALDQASFSIDKGELVIIAGPAGGLAVIQARGFVSIKRRKYIPSDL